MTPAILLMTIYDNRRQVIRMLMWVLGLLASASPQGRGVKGAPPWTCMDKLELKGSAHVKDSRRSVSVNAGDIDPLIAAAPPRPADGGGPVDLQGQKSAVYRLRHTKRKSDP